MPETAAKTQALSRLKGEEGDFIQVSDSFEVKQGATLLEGVCIGPLLGAGLQGQVFQLNDSGSHATGWVLKAVASSGSAAMARRLFPAMVREWAIGRLLVRAFGAMHEGLAPESTEVVGFMRTGAAVVSRSNHLKFRGLILEHLNGESMDKRLGSRKSTELQNIHCIRQMLLEVFTALAAAQKSVGFRHWDLRLANIMEHSLTQYANSVVCTTASDSHDVAEGSSSRSCYKMIDFGHSEVKRGRELRGPTPDIHVPRIPFTERSYRLFWVYKRDVYRLLMSLQNVLDGSSFPGDDARDAQLLADLVHHVTGVRMKLYVEGQNQAKQLCSMPWDRPAPQDGHSGCLRLSYIRMKSFVVARHPSISASKALQHPFFKCRGGSKA